jgi:NhaA family Na+:H+ antiporter
MIRAFLKLPAAAGILLVACALLALIVANSPLIELYEGLLAIPFAVRAGPLEIDKPLLLWINDGLMAIFFMHVGLEIKRELVQGELSTWDQASLPVIGALGGMAVPALVYLVATSGRPDLMSGWAIPAATDIAFALSVLMLVGPRVPPALKVFLLALAIIDDLGSIVIIALFYASDLSFLSLLLAGVGLATLAALNLRGVRRLTPYVLVGIAIWVCVLKSGVHATLAGVAVALFVPLRTQGPEPPPLPPLAHALEPWVNFAVMPVFAFANAGVSFAGLSLADVFAPLPLGIAGGLFLGKQLGVCGTAWIAVRLGLCQLPAGASWISFYGVSLLTGIGFTMSLFIGSLAFAGVHHAPGIRLGVLTGSILSAIAGYAVLRSVGRSSPRGAAGQAARR